MKTIRLFLFIAICSLAMPVFAQNVQFSANTKAFQLQVGELSSLKSSQAGVVAGLG